MEIDPIRERRDMEARLAQANKLKTLMYVLIAVAVVLVAALAYVWSQKTSLINELEDEKQDLTEQMENLQNDYATLSSDYDSINSQLDTSRAEVANLIERIKKTEATNRAKMRQYEKELGTLRSIMRNYIVQIDSLNTLNHKLTADADAARRSIDTAGRESHRSGGGRSSHQGARSQNGGLYVQRQGYRQKQQGCQIAHISLARGERPCSERPGQSVYPCERS